MVIGIHFEKLLICISKQMFLWHLLYGPKHSNPEAILAQGTTVFPIVQDSLLFDCPLYIAELLFEFNKPKVVEFNKLSLQSLSFSNFKISQHDHQSGALDLLMKE